MEESFPSHKSTWQEKLLRIGLIIFTLTPFVCVPFVNNSIRLGSPPPLCKFTHKTSFVDSMTDQESKILTVSLYGEYVDCTTDVQLDIINFDISPPEPVQKASIFVNQTTQVVWVLRPKSQGNFSYVVSFPGSQILSSDESAVTVTNAIGFPVWVTDNLAPLAVFVFGPLLTVPYWIDKCSEWFKKRKGKHKTQAGKTPRRHKRR